MLKNTCVLFGAGADAPFNIGTGGDFAKSVLGTVQASGRMNAAIKEHYDRIVLHQDEWYPRYLSRYWKEDDLLKAALRRRNLERNNKPSDKEFKSCFDKCKRDPALKKTLINDYPSYMGIVDGKFSSIIAPTVLGRGRFWQVVSCYCRAYLTIVQQILGQDDYERYLSPTKELIAGIRAACRKPAGEDSYYSVIRKLKSSFDISVITTNYTLYCEEISNLEENHIAYVHGRVGLFESPRDLCVYDVEHQDIANEIVFPYLFIQSGIKPIVERKQIKEYSKMVKFMDDAKRIVILGYRLNYDDNHINSIIRSAVKQKKEVVYLAYHGNHNDVLSNDVDNILDKLRLPEKPSNLLIQSITNDNAQIVFENALTGNCR